VGAIHLCWEKATARGVRYYEVDLYRDLWGEWLLARAWGRRGTRLGRVRVAPCGSRDEGLARIAAILKQRQQRWYRLVASVDSDSDIR
jgi:predicted DNA-binding WGR domain protein